MIIHIQDDFLPDAMRHREQALDEGTFEGEDYAGHFYPGVQAHHPLDVVDEIEEAVESKVEVNFAFWRLSKPGEDTPAPIHADSICSEWAGLLYMTPTEEMGGTAFWRYRATGDSELPPRVRRTDSQYSRDYIDEINRHSADETQWDMTALVKAQFNRFVAYPTHYFHSRYPFYSENYGTSKEEARLIWVVFFNKIH